MDENTLLSDIELGALLCALRDVDSLPGAVAEVGVWRGGTAQKLSDAAPHRELHLFDSFCGMQHTSEFDVHEVGHFRDTSLEHIRSLLGNRTNVILHPGWFPKTFEDVKHLQFCFVHLDADLYESTRDALEFFYSRLVHGGVIVVHDYGFANCPGVKKAVDEFAPDHCVKLTEFQLLITRR